MTTIAADYAARVMCSDSYWVDGDACGIVRKVFRVRDELLGFAGGIKERDEWLLAWRKHKEILPLEDLSILRLAPGGLSVWNSTDGWHKVEGRFAIGTGASCARGAMAAGTTCRRAVQIARTIDATTGGPVREYKL